jgi:hypothetical protein
MSHVMRPGHTTQSAVTYTLRLRLGVFVCMQAVCPPATPSTNHDMPQSANPRHSSTVGGIFLNCMRHATAYIFHGRVKCKQQLLSACVHARVITHAQARSGGARAVGVITLGVRCFLAVFVCTSWGLPVAAAVIHMPAVVHNSRGRHEVAHTGLPGRMSY